MDKSDFQEEIAKLYLRLNGYITSSLIIHSPERKKNKTEIDLIAVRFPHHNQEDRMIECCDYLQIPQNTIDIIIGEVKGGKNSKNQFNTALWNDRDALEKLVRWIGILPPNRTNEIVDWLANELPAKSIQSSKKFPFLIIDNLYTIRPMVFNLDDSAVREKKSRFVYGNLMMQYIYDCFCPKNERPTCSTLYPFNLWGSTFFPIVEYFKGSNKTSPGTVKELYQHFNLG